MEHIRSTSVDFTNTYCGITATQTWNDFRLWEEILNTYTYIDSIIELGTGYGGFSLYLKHQSEQRDLKFTTFDNEAWVGFYGKKMDRKVLGSSFVELDIFEESQCIIDVIQSSNHPILFCDNGNKPKEVELFSPFIPSGGLIIVHDWNTEITIKDINFDFKVSHFGEATAAFLKA